VVYGISTSLVHVKTIAIFIMHVHKGVMRLDGAQGKKQIWRSHLRKPMRCIEENTCDIVGIFQRPCSDMVPGKLCAPFVTPLTVQYLVETLLNAQ